MLNKTEYLLTQLGEEASEIAHRCSKAIRFGLSEVEPGQDKTNEERLIDEVMDIVGVLTFLYKNSIIDLPDDAAATKTVDAKHEKIKKYMDYSRQEGTLEPEPNVRPD